MARLTALVVLVLGVACGCGSSGSAHHGSGTAASDVRRVPPFTAVELAGGADVTVTAGEPRRVVVRADDNLLDRVATRVVGDRLVVDEIGSFTTETPLRVSVTAPRIDELVLSGGGLLRASNIDSRTLTVTHSGGGVVEADGSVRSLSVLLSGGGTAELAHLIARDARVRLTGAGSVLVDSTRNLSATLGGAGSIVYTGSPAHVTTHVTGSGTVTPG
jgi:hypothetical protein